ncbi:TRAP transporter permease [Saccharospirillum impatiens]|uniref:TRAP transporter permease n=1 Tax=Saccharospirillum impatiens TaxID=169438 RepID=UPI0003F4F2F8|nr:TRAP transporter fused permease subunit [Saccharospirillum impatiens]
MTARHSDTLVMTENHWTALVVRGLAIALTLTSIVWAADLPRTLGASLYTEQFIVAILGLTLGLAYFKIASDQRGHSFWVSLIAGVLSLGIAGYFAFYYADLVTVMAFTPVHLVVLGGLIVLLTIEALRRLVGWPLTIVVSSFLLYSFFGEYIPGMLSSRPISFERLWVYLSLDPNAMLGMPLIVASTIIIPFIFMGQLLKASGGSSFFTDVSLALMGRYRGGPAKVSITASSLFGSISGSAVSNVATTGIMTIPMMTKAGYTPRVAGAIEALASSGGQLMPPVMGAAAFLMAEFLQVPYGDVIVAALVPSLLFYIALFIQAHLEAARRGIAPVEASLIPPLLTVLAKGWHFILPFAVLIIALFRFNLSPEAAVLAALVPLIISGFVLGYDDHRLDISTFMKAVSATGTSVVDIITICAGAGLVIGVLNITGLGFGLTLALVEVGDGNPVILLGAAALISLILGMGMPTVGVYVLLATLVAPALVEVGIQPMAAHLFVLYFGMLSMITPPVALAAFTAASISRSEPMRTGLTAMRLGWIAYLIPFLFVADPAFILDGTTGDIALTLTTAVAGVWLASMGVIGYVNQSILWRWRVLFMLSGFGLLLPSPIFPGAEWSDLAGGLLGLVLIAWFYLRLRLLPRLGSSG